MYSMRFDMRAPDFGAAASEFYAAAIDMCAWAETRGCLAAVICEHVDEAVMPALRVAGG